MKNCLNCKYSHDVGPYLACYAQKNAPRVDWNDVCKSWKSEHITNADRLRQMTDEGLADFIAMQRFSVVNPIADTLGIDVTMAFIAGRKNALNWLKQETESDG